MKTLNWTTVTASTYPTDAEAVERVTMLSPACCSDGKSILWTAATTTSAPGLDESSSKSSSGSKFAKLARKSKAMNKAFQLE